MFDEDELEERVDNYKKKNGKNTLVGKILFSGFAIFFLILTSITYFLAFKNNSIKNENWYEIQVTYQNAQVKSIHHGMAGERKSIHLFTKEIIQPIVADTFLFKNSTHKNFIQEIKKNEKFYVIVPKNRNSQIPYVSLGGLRKGDQVYFSLDDLKEIESKGKLIIKILFWITLGFTLFWLYFTFKVLTKKDNESLSQKLTQ